MLMRYKFKFDNLINEMLDKLPKETWIDPSKTFMDPAMAGGQFINQVIKRLRVHGHSDENIASRVWGMEAEESAVLYAINKNKLIGKYCQYSPGDVNYEFKNMKFDVVLSNPPYQSPTGSLGGGSSPLYEQFVYLAQKITEENGFIAFITPPSAFKIGFGRLPNKEIIFINLDVHKHFPKIGSSFWYFIQQKNRTGLTEFQTGSDKFEVNVGPTDLVIPSSLIEFNLYKKIISYTGGISLKSFNRDKKPFPINAVFIRRLNRHDTFNALLTYEGFEKDVKLNQDYTLEHPEAQKIVESFNHPVYTFLWRVYSSSPFITLGWIRTLNIAIGDIYKELNLTQEEIYLIESTIK